MTNRRFFSDVPADGKWIRPGTDQATVGREIVGNAMREYLARNPEQTTTDAQQQRQAARQEWIERRQGREVIDAAYNAAQERKANAWRDDVQRLSDAAESSYRRNLQPAITTDAEAQKQREAAHAEWLARRYGKDSDAIESAYQAHMKRLGDKQ
ncbi:MULTISPECIES: hypothetical protein [Halomonas]|uniref:Uncharacterized protein n=1 Tax=Halomonas halophila TaxID=29573 RepID=A0ABQ0U3H1_9GAMM|nr:MULTISPECIES: hypothetical protein [Halomonas]MDR5890289.1 hypothetical protein [Halomonas salina]WJY05793.1 hypothetical protein QWG60_08665 [Halomonas halophila]GEK72945.1 hypothetical protein HHA04nite_14890 [Halomonas halophila]